MNKRLRSIPFLSLYAAAVAAVVLNGGRGRWGAMPWFPIAVGVTAAMAIIPLRHLFEERLLDRSRGDGLRVVFFFFGGLAPLAAIPYLGREDALLILGMMVMSAFFIWGAFGTLFQWPGFRRPAEGWECERCRYDLTENTSGVCPECGTPIGDDAEMLLSETGESAGLETGERRLPDEH